ncbi:MAG: hypothetical protein QOE59_5076 [Actinomycetota bacterium]|jgi:hypothetical protein|nr:hypothetical protein [Actinomycetota bacterium]
MAAAAGETVILCESEPSCDALRGHYATTWAGGAGSPTEQLASVGAVDVVVIPDHDDAGLACLERITDVLPGAGSWSVSPVRTPRTSISASASWPLPNWCAPHPPLRPALPTAA